MADSILRTRGIKALIVVCGTSLAAACSSVVSQHGYVPTERALESVKTGEDTKASVRNSLGSPSNIGSFDENTWYYISSTMRKFGPFRGDVIDRTILAVEFNEEQKVADIRRYGIEDGIVVDYSGRVTPTRGKELSFLQQMFGNIGRLPTPGQEGQQGPGRR